MHLYYTVQVWGIDDEVWTVAWHVPWEDLYWYWLTLMQYRCW